MQPVQAPTPRLSRKERLRGKNPHRYDNLIRTATQVFADEGFNGSSVNRLAKQVGVGVGTIYSYFDDKEDLFLACVRRAAETDLAGKSERMDETQPALNMLKAIVRIDHELMERDPDGQRLLKSVFYGINSQLPITPEAQALYFGSMDLVQRALDKGTQEGVFALGQDGPLAALLINGLMETFFVLGRTLGGNDTGATVELAERALELVCRGIVSPSHRA